VAEFSKEGCGSKKGWFAGNDDSRIILVNSGIRIKSKYQHN
jgi:hypothetical protein